MLPLSENALDEMVARERERGAPPLTEWGSLSERLRAEGLIREPAASRLVTRRWLQAAAALLLTAGGAAIGRMSAGAAAIPLAAISAGSGGSSAESGQPAAESPAPAAQPAASLASTAEFKTPDEAWEALNRAGEEYQRASAFLSASNTEVPLPVATSQYRTRLVALDNVMSEMRDALKEAPQDPVINQYYLATVGAREATLRQMGTTLPASARLNRF